MSEKQLTPNYIFEVSWEVCNKVGGIHTVISSKALTLQKHYENHLIMIGPDFLQGDDENSEFAEDKTLFVAWQNYAHQCGLKVKTGRWKIAGNPIVVLVDFKPFYENKNQIFGELWSQYKLDSISGQDDYIQPALFGYAAGKVIESFYHHHLSVNDKVVAQFHEWLTGVGLLYLHKNIPEVATVFTTHATVTGRLIAGSGLPLYSKFEEYNGDEIARRFNCVAKHSLEKKAAFSADCLTTVSEITDRECIHFLEKKSDVITPNGFDKLMVSDELLFKEKRSLARKKLFSVAQSLLGSSLPEDSVLVIHSGRYEFHNKGIDVFIDALGELNKTAGLTKNTVAFIVVPASNSGPQHELQQRLAQNNYSRHWGNKILTHYLHHLESDAILHRFHHNQLDNSDDKKVKVIFVPAYMNGSDGVFNLQYYDLLIGFDLSVFPSYYEPFGYTPLESLMFHIPTVTTTLSGFGKMMQKKSKSIEQGIAVLERNDTNALEITHNISSLIREFSNKNTQQISELRSAAFQCSHSALWKNKITHYEQAYSLALQKANVREHLLGEKKLDESRFPLKLKPLLKLSKNFWWTWNFEARQLFELADKKLWASVYHNPIALLQGLSAKRIAALEKNAAFVKELKVVHSKLEDYLFGKNSASPKIAYFCMEYGLSSGLKIYSGGLGVLAGDYLKEASDSGVNMVAVGLLYHNGYFKQQISSQGEQVVIDDFQKFTNLPLHSVRNKEGNKLKIGISFPGRTVYVRVWKADIGRIPLYLLDTDIRENSVADREITARLYAGDLEHRIKQELILGIGGVRLLHTLEIDADVCHYNEGHAAFAGLERLIMLVQEQKKSFGEALQIVRSSSVFTTHTPISAGHDRFWEDLMYRYLSYAADLLNIPWKKLMALGRVNEDDAGESFSMSHLAIRLSNGVNGVSAIHGRVSRKMFESLWKENSSEESRIGHVTNGVHYATWTSREWQLLYEMFLGEGFAENISDKELWKKIQSVPDKTIWDTRLQCKKSLVELINVLCRNDFFLEKLKNKKDFLADISTWDDRTLFIGFARRFTAYKRSTLLFADLKRLESIVANTNRPVVFLFAGKAHSKDFEGQLLIRRIMDISTQDAFLGHIIFLEDYDIDLAKYLTQGVDVWLNTPEPEMEASGTSGMKAALNGVLNCSVSDGWWAEAANAEVGWTIPVPPAINDNAADAEMLYQLLENEIIPLYFDRNQKNIPVKWIAKIKNSVAQIVPQFTTQRMMKEYMSKYYLPLDKKKNK